jgi:hypothetical protein
VNEKNRKISWERSKAMKSQDDVKAITTYTSELFRIDQPRRHWNFRILGNFFAKLRDAIYSYLAEPPQTSQSAPLPLQTDRATGAEPASDNGGQAPRIGAPQPMAFVGELQPYLPPAIDCGIARLLQRDICSNPPRDWRCLITTESMTTRLEKLKTIVANPAELQNFPDIADYIQSFTHALDTSDESLIVRSLFEKESHISSYLTFLARHKPSQLNDLFFTAPQADHRPAAGQS